MSDDDEVTLVLSEEEAVSIYHVTGCVAGLPKLTARAINDSIYCTLDESVGDSDYKPTYTSTSLIDVKREPEL